MSIRYNYQGTIIIGTDESDVNAQCTTAGIPLAFPVPIPDPQAASDAADAKYLGLPLAIQDAFATKYQVIKTARALGKYQEALDFFDTLTFPQELQPLADAIRVDLANF